jgi:hypothetical protein
MLQSLVQHLSESLWYLLPQNTNRPTKTKNKTHTWTLKKETDWEASPGHLPARQVTMRPLHWIPIEGFPIDDGCIKHRDSSKVEVIQSLLLSEIQNAQTWQSSTTTLSLKHRECPRDETSREERGNNLKRKKELISQQSSVVWSWWTRKTMHQVYSFDTQSSTNRSSCKLSFNRSCALTWKKIAKQRKQDRRKRRRPPPNLSNLRADPIHRREKRRPRSMYLLCAKNTKLRASWASSSLLFSYFHAVLLRIASTSSSSSFLDGHNKRTRKLKWQRVECDSWQNTWVVERTNLVSLCQVFSILVARCSRTTNDLPVSSCFARRYPALFLGTCRWDHLVREASKDR